MFFVFCRELTQRFFFVIGFGKPIVALSFWVSGIILYARAPSLNNVKGKWFISCVLFLNMFLVFVFTSKTFLSFYFFFESTLVPILFLLLI